MQIVNLCSLFLLVLYISICFDGLDAAEALLYKLIESSKLAVEKLEGSKSTAKAIQGTSDPSQQCMKACSAPDVLPPTDPSPATAVKPGVKPKVFSHNKLVFSKGK